MARHIEDGNPGELFLFNGNWVEHIPSISTHILWLYVNATGAREVGGKQGTLGQTVQPMLLSLCSWDPPLYLRCPREE